MLSIPFVRGGVLAFAAAMAVSATSASAVLSGNALTFNVSSGSFSGSYTVTQAMGTFTGNDFDFTSAGPIQIFDGSTLLATLSDVNVSYFGDPVVAYAFNVTAAGAPINVTVTSGTLGFGSLLNPLGSASTGGSLTDLNGNGAVMTGGFAGPKAFRATYNGSSTFGDFGSGISIGPPYFSNDLNDGAANVVIPGFVSSISSSMSFSLTAQDTAGINTVFGVVPTPGTMALLGLGGLVAARRRR